MERNKITDFAITVIGGKSQHSKSSTANPDGDDFYHLRLSIDNNITKFGKKVGSSPVKMFALVFKKGMSALFDDISLELSEGRTEEVGDNLLLTNLVLRGSWDNQKTNPYFVTDEKGNNRLDANGEPIMNASVGFFTHETEDISTAYRRASKGLKFAPIEIDDQTEE